MDERARDELLLHEEARAYLHLAADAERVDALVAGGVSGARANQLPVIILRAAPLGHERATVSTHSNKVEPPVAARVRDRGGARVGYRLGEVERLELPF